MDRQGKDFKLRLVSTFLSHSSENKPLVEAVAVSLGRRGVLTWLDREELALGPLEVALKEAVREQATVTLFLSEAYLRSEWCLEELRWAVEAGSGIAHLLPVYLDDPLKLVREHELLRSRFLHPDGDKVSQLGFLNPADPANPDPDAVAEKIADAAYRRSIPAAWSEVAIILDQRGDGPRRGLPPLPENVMNLEIPALTFRPSPLPRQQRETLAGREWSEVAGTMTSSLATALGVVRGDPRKVRVLGAAQTGLWWAVGSHFNRTTSADLYGYDRTGLAFTNKGQDRLTPLQGGDPHRAKPLSDSARNLPPDQPRVALGVGPAAVYAEAVRKASAETPLFWIESGRIDDSQQAMALVADLVASLARLRTSHGVREVALFWTTASSAALLAAANLTPHVIPSVRYMEWDHHRCEYTHLPM